VDEAQRARAARAARAAAAFELDGEPRGVEPFGSGHIHETYRLACATPAGERRYVLQRINAVVFPWPERVVLNSVRVSEHLRLGLADRGRGDVARRALRFRRARSGGFLHRDAEAGVWRVCDLVEATHTCDVVRSPAEARAIARAFGEFLGLCADLDASSIEPALPGFHDLAAYARRLDAAAAADPHGRARECADEIAAARAAWRALSALRDAASMPIRIVHADCKANNVLLDDASGEGLCVIDLDTVMPGLLVDDFGQLARSATCSAAEDERDLSRIGFDLRLFEALVEGFLEGCGDAPTPAELAALPLAGPLSALEHVLRFLADHLEGDVYFRVRRSGQNLDRTRAQRRLLESMQAARPEAERIVRDASARRAGLRR
jgi:Ser/Thr protein kinase RdoA (MazF antagonist)